MKEKEYFNDANTRNGSLFQTFQLINSWLQWAEIKHGTLLALNSAILLGLIAILLGNQGSDTLANILNQTTKGRWIVATIVIAIICIVFAILISAYSFYPDIGKEKQDDTSATAAKGIQKVLDKIEKLLERIISAIKGNKKPASKKPASENTTPKNLIFFHDAATFTSDDYLTNFEGDSEFGKMIAQEIVYNSKIANRKYEKFSVSLFFSLFSYVAIGIAIAVYLY